MIFQILVVILLIIIFNNIWDKNKLNIMKSLIKKNFTKVAIIIDNDYFLSDLILKLELALCEISSGKILSEIRLKRLLISIDRYIDEIITTSDSGNRLNIIILMDNFFIETIKECIEIEEYEDATNLKWIYHRLFQKDLKI